MNKAKSIYEFDCEDNKGDIKSLSDFKGQVLLVVNTASKCGFTPQYEGLEKLHQDFHQRGFSVLGFPCNQFGGQEPGNDEEIQSFCALTLGSPSQCFPKLMSMEMMPHLCINF